MFQPCFLRKKGFWRRNHGTVCYGAVPSGAASFFMATVEKTCSCFGHSNVDITDDLIARTNIEIDRAIEDGVRIFLFGGRSDFDDLCYDLVTQKRNDSPQLNIRRVFCFALDKQLRKPPRWFIKKEYEALECPAKGFDYWYTAIYYRNLAMIDQSDFILGRGEGKQRRIQDVFVCSQKA